MSIRTRAVALLAGSAAALLIGPLASAAGATPTHLDFGRGDRGGAVFVQTDNVAGNQVVAYDRHADGSLTAAGTYATGGVGGVLTGSVVDHTASQGSLAYDAGAGLLYAVNAGSNTVSVFAVRGDQLRLVQRVASGGTFPVSIATHGNLVEVLNARDGGSVAGFWRIGDRLFAIPGSDPALGLNPAATPEFVNTPGEVTFSPDGSKVLVSTKANTNSVDVFSVRWWGGLSATPVVNSFAGDVPFAITWDAAGHAVLANAGTGAVISLSLGSNGVLTPISTVFTSQAATCWISRAGSHFYASNAGSGSVTEIAGSSAGSLSLVGNTAADAGTVDSAATPDGRFLYVQGGAAGTVHAFAVHADGSLSSLGSVTVPDAVGGEGIAAS